MIAVQCHSFLFGFQWGLSIALRKRGMCVWTGVSDGTDARHALKWSALKKKVRSSKGDGH